MSNASLRKDLRPAGKSDGLLTYLAEREVFLFRLSMRTSHLLLKFLNLERKIRRRAQQGFVYFLFSG